MQTATHNKELEALISLVDEPSEEMFGTIKGKILDYGMEALPLLEAVEIHHPEDRLNQRLSMLIQDIRFKDIFQALYHWSEDKHSDLHQAAFIISRIRQPELEESAFLKLLDKLIQDVWLEINDNLTPLEKVKVVNHVFFDVYGFRGMGLTNDVLDGFFLSELLREHEGNSLSISMLYVIVAQRLKIPIYGVNLPQHFILAYMDDKMDLRNPGTYMENDVIFYLNAMNKGAVFTQNEVRLYLKQMKLEPQTSYYMPCDSRTIIRRLITEMSSAYELASRKDEANLIAGLLSALPE